MSTAIHRLRTLAAAAPDARALHDGEAWCTRAELLARAEAAPTPAGRAVPVSDADPAVALVNLLAAELAGAVPLVCDPAWPACDDRLRAATERRPRPTGEPLLAVLTSGSSGNPRTVVRTAASWAASARSFDQVAGLRDGDVVWAPGALSSTLTLFAAWHAVATGRPVVLGRTARPAAAAAEATVLHAVPAVAAEAVTAAAGGLLPRLRTIVVAGAHVPAVLRERAAGLGLRLVEYYGAAELSFVAAGGRGGLRPFPGCRVEIRDRHGVAQPVGAEGEIWVSSPYLSQGYLETGDAVLAGGPGGPFRRAGEWATVGDRGRFRPDGTLAVIGRGDTAVDVGGHTVPVADVEAVLQDVPGVLEVACVGQPHPRLGHWLVAAVRPEPGTDPLPQLKAAARASLPRAARPSRWVLLDELPRTPGGKIARHSLVELLSPVGTGGAEDAL